MNSIHALKRTAERLTDAGLDLNKVAAKLDEIARVTSKHWDSVAVLLITLSEKRGDCASADYNDRESNGEEVWAVIRQGRVTTVMLRRKEQPKRPDCFGVDKVLRVTP